MRRIPTVALAAALAAGALAGTQLAAHAAMTKAVHTAKLSADESGGLYFNKKKLTVDHGKVTIVMTNPAKSGIAHGIGVSGNGVDKDGKVVKPGKKSTLTLTLKKGKYVFYCPVPSHKAGGMKGTLTVR